MVIKIQEKDRPEGEKKKRKRERKKERKEREKERKREQKERKKERDRIYEWDGFYFHRRGLQLFSGLLCWISK